MNREHARKLISSIAVILGACWTCSAVIPPLTKLWSDEPIGLLFLLTMVPLLASPGILAVVFGIRLFREMRESSLRWVIGLFFTLFAFFLSSQTSELFPHLLPDGLQFSVFLFSYSLVAIYAYIFVIRLLLRYFTTEDRTLRSLLSRDLIILMAWQVWLLLSQFFQEYSPVKEGYTHVPKEPWGMLGVLVPIAVAYGLYRLLAPPKKEAQQAAPRNR